jgi:hypothetical protein
VQEVVASTLALRWVIRQAQFHTTRVVMLSDSQVAVGCLAKGRSSAASLVRHLRRFAGLALSGDVQVFLVWVPTEDNPSDGPSRGRGVEL